MAATSAVEAPLAQQLLGDPFVGDPPIRVWKALADLQSTQPIGIDLKGRRLAASISVSAAATRDSPQSFGLLPQLRALRGPAGLRIQDLDPGGVAVQVATLWLLIENPARCPR